MRASAAECTCLSICLSKLLPFSNKCKGTPHLTKKNGRSKHRLPDSGSTELFDLPCHRTPRGLMGKVEKMEEVGTCCLSCLCGTFCASPPHCFGFNSPDPLAQPFAELPPLYMLSSHLCVVKLDKSSNELQHSLPLLPICSVPISTTLDILDFMAPEKQKFGKDHHPQ